MKLYWSYLLDEVNRDPRYAATDTPKKIGDRIELSETLGFIEKQRDGSWSAYSSPFNFLGNDRNKKFAAKIVERHLEMLWERNNEKLDGVVTFCRDLCLFSPGCLSDQAIV